MNPTITTPTGTPLVLNDRQKEYQSFLLAHRLVRAAAEAVEQELQSVASVAREKTRTLARDFAAANRVDAARATALCEEIKAARGKFEKNREHLICLQKHLEEVIAIFEAESCADALVVLQERLGKLAETEAERKALQERIKQLQQQCASVQECA